MKLVLTASARVNLRAIGDWIASDSPQRAVTFIKELERHCATLALRPKIHPLLLGYEASGIRKAVHGNYLIFYRIAGDNVEVLHILHGAQDWQSMLFDSDDPEI
jgi:plasmid stabilization system protein ParE